MIVNVRVDHRLLHGQVAMAWNQVLGSDCILIANDSVPNDEIRKAGIKLAKPANTKLVIKNMDASVEALVSGVTDKYKLFIVVESIADVYKLCKETGMIDVKYLFCRFLYTRQMIMLLKEIVKVLQECTC